MYYMGDFRSMRGDYYAGDPGILSFLGRIGKAAVGFIPGVGPVASKVIEGAGTLATRAAKSKVGQVVVKHPTLSAAGAAAVAGTGGGMLTGKRLARPKISGVMGHRRRRIRVTNVKALRRAIRRARGFEKLARKVMHFTSPRKPKGRAVFRVRRRK